MTKNIIAYAVMTAVTAALYFLVGGREFLILLIIVATIPPVSLVYALIVRERIKYISTASCEVVVRGEKASFTVAVADEDLFMPYPYVSVAVNVNYDVGETVVVSPVFTMTPRSNVEFSFDVSTKHIGKYSVGIERIEMWDILRLFKLRYTVSNALRVDVFPRLQQVSGDIESGVRSSETADGTFIKTSGDVFAGTREYVPGDTLKRVHWKSTAHVGHLMTKLSENGESGMITAIVDLRPPENIGPGDYGRLHDALDIIIETVYALFEKCMGRGFAFCLQLVDGVSNESLVSSDGSLAEVIAGIGFSEYTAISFEEACNGVRIPDSSFVLISGHPDAGLAYCVSEGMEAAAAVFALPDTDEAANLYRAESFDLVRKLEENGVQVTVISRAEQISELL